MTARPTRRIRVRQAEAAVWLTKLRSDNRHPSIDAAFQDWLRSDPLNSQAFDKATQVWEGIGGAARLRPARTVRMRVYALAMAAAFALVIGGFAAAGLFAPAQVYSAGPGEQHTFLLKDGSSVTLNASSAIEVRMKRRERSITLARGEAYFDVAHDADRPFVVSAMNRQVRALGTAFMLNRHDGDLDVTLMRGKIAISEPNHEAAVVLRPRQQWRLSSNRVVSLSPVQLESVAAWRDGEAIFDGTALRDAALTMNRLSVDKVAPAAEVADLKISGVFRATEGEDFARTVATLYNLEVTRTPAGLVLSAASTKNIRADVR